MNPLILWNDIVKTATLASSTLDSGYNVQSIIDQRPYTLAKFDAAGTNYIEITLDAVTDVDTLFICGHNLNTVGASIQLQKWNGSAYENVTGASSTPANDNALMLHFTEVSALKYKLVITNTLGLPYIGVLLMGVALEMEYPPDTPRSPYDESISAEIANSKAGMMLGASVNYNPMEVNHTFSLITRTWVQTNFIPFWNYAKQLNRFAYALDLTNEADQVFYCRLKEDFVFSLPATSLLYYDSVQLNCYVER